MRNAAAAAALLLLLLAACAGAAPPVELHGKGSEHHLDWWLGIPF